MKKDLSKDKTPIKRQLIPGMLAKRFMTDYHESIKDLPLDRKIELTEHLMGTVDFLKAFSAAQDDKIYQEYVALEAPLLKRFGKTLKVYHQKAFHKYFDFDLVLTEKDIISDEEFNAMDSIEEQRPSEKELNRFIRIINNGLYFERDFLFLERDPEFEPNEKAPGKNGINWTGTKEGKNDFVQMIYGLHKAGIINAGKGEITKLVEILAPVFNVELGNNWQSNHSASIHKVNRNYQPPVFDRIKEAYLQYAEGLIEDKKKKQ